MLAKQRASLATAFLSWCHNGRHSSPSSRPEHLVAERRLWQLAVGWAAHLTTQPVEDELYGALATPVGQRTPVALHSAVNLYAVHVDRIGKLHLRRLVRVLRPAVDRERVDAVVEGGVKRPEDRAIPLRQGHVIRALQAPRHGRAFLGLLPLLELGEQAEVAWHNYCGRAALCNGLGGVRRRSQPKTRLVRLVCMSRLRRRTCSACGACVGRLWLTSLLRA
mmetsp:Transcript_42197/g.133985  ORF Transcript_42197/g.133985 Transcript_42197/m.133985 type:complete len:221 (-) Transcript_42197:57-719(-)